MFSVLLSVLAVLFRLLCIVLAYKAAAIGNIPMTLFWLTGLVCGALADIVTALKDTY